MSLRFNVIGFSLPIQLKTLLWVVSKHIHSHVGLLMQYNPPTRESLDVKGSTNRFVKSLSVSIVTETTTKFGFQIGLSFNS